MSPTTNVSRALPDIVNVSWLAAYPTSITIIGIIVGVESSLLFFMKTDSNFPKGLGSYGKQALLILAYCGVFLPLSAVLSGFILSYMLGRISVQLPKELSDEEEADSSRGHEGRPSLSWLRWHWTFALILGTVIPIVQGLLYAWLVESKFVRITLSVIAVFTALPMVSIIVPHSVVST